MKNDADKGHRWIRSDEDEADCANCGLRYASWWRKGKKDECQHEN